MDLWFLEIYKTERKHAQSPSAHCDRNFSRAHMRGIELDFGKAFQKNISRFSGPDMATYQI